MKEIDRHIKLIKKYIQEYSKENSIEINEEILFDFFEEKKIKYRDVYINAETIETALDQLDFRYMRAGSKYYCKGADE